MGETNENVYRPPSQDEVNYTHVDITDDFMFAYVMQSPDICIELLEYLFQDIKSKGLSILQPMKNRKST